MALTQGHAAAVQEAVGAGLLGCKAPFRLMRSHSRSACLETSVLALKEWLFSEHFERYLLLSQVCACLLSSCHLFAFAIFILCGDFAACLVFHAGLQLAVIVVGVFHAISKA